ncbi:uncharacterized protein LOC144948987 [Lampetra fluviatilis]
MATKKNPRGREPREEEAGAGDPSHPGQQGGLLSEAAEGGPDRLEDRMEDRMARVERALQELLQRLPMGGPPAPGPPPPRVLREERPREPDADQPAGQEPQPTSSRQPPPLPPKPPGLNTQHGEQVAGRPRRLGPVDKFVAEEEDWEEFVRRFEAAFHALEWTDEEALRALPSVLGKEALSSYTSLPSHSKSTLQAAYEALGEIYCLAEGAFKRFQDRQRGAKESPLAYRGALLVLARRAFPRLAEEALEDLVVEHLIAYACRAGVVMPVVTPEERTSLWAARTIQAHEQVMGRAPPVGPVAGAAGGNSRAVAAALLGPATLTAEPAPSPQAAGGASGDGPPTSETEPSLREVYAAIRGLAEQRDQPPRRWQPPLQHRAEPPRRNAPWVCHRCGREGHVARGCRTEPEAANVTWNLPGPNADRSQHPM